MTLTTIHRISKKHARCNPSRGWAVLLLCLVFGEAHHAWAQQFKKPTDSRMLERLEPPSGKLSVVIDTDTYNEIDDQFAVAYALLSPERLEVKAIYAAPFLNVRSSDAGDGMRKSYDEILRVLDRMGVPGRAFAYRGSPYFLKSLHEPINSDASRDLIRRAMAEEDRLYVLTLGAATNVASAILMEPKIVDKIVVVWLGGQSPDQEQANEFNLEQDLLAAKVLFDSGVPLVLLHTGVTAHLVTTLPEVEWYLKARGPLGDYLCEIFEGYYSDHFGASKIIWDIAAIAYLIDPDWVSTKVKRIPVLTDEMTYRADSTRHYYRVATGLNRDKIFGDLFRKVQAYGGSQLRK